MGRRFRGPGHAGAGADTDTHADLGSVLLGSESGQDDRLHRFGVRLGNDDLEPGSGKLGRLDFGHPLAGSGTCGAATIAVGYSLNSGAGFQVQWLTNTATSCPVPSTPTSTPGSGQAFAASDGNGPCFFCNDTPIIATYTMGTTAPENLLRTGHSSQVVTLTFNDTTATNLTSDFANIWLASRPRSP